MKIDFNQLRSDLTGEFAFHFPIFLIGAPLSILSTVAQDYDSQRPSSIIQWLLASSIGYGVVLALAWLTHNWQTRNGRIRVISIPLYIVLCLGIGASKGFFTGFIGGLLGDTSNLNNAIATRTISSGILGMISIPIGSSLAANHYRFLQKRIELIRESVALASARQVNDSVIASLQQSALLDTQSEIGIALQPILDEISNSSLGDESQWAKIATGIREIAQDQIRPIAHDLWNQRESNYPKYSAWEFIRLTVQNFNFPIILVVFFAEIGGLSQYLRESPGDQVFQKLTVIALSIMSPFVILKALTRTKFISAEMSYFVFFISAPVIEFFLYRNLFQVTDFAKFVVHIVLFASLLIVTTLFVGAISTANSYSKKLLEELQNLIDAERVESIASETYKEVINRDIAKFIHGQLQSRMMALALSIEQNLNESDARSLSNNVNQIEEELKNPLKRFQYQSFASVTEGIESAIKDWGGLVTIEFLIALDESQLKQRTISNICTVLDESISNAVRHGLATSVSIYVGLASTEDILIKVTDNGVGPTQGVHGLGSSLFDSICGAGWKLNLRADEFGSEFTALIPRLFN